MVMVLLVSLRRGHPLSDPRTAGPGSRCGPGGVSSNTRNIQKGDLVSTKWPALDGAGNGLNKRT